VWQSMFEKALNSLKVSHLATIQLEDVRRISSTGVAPQTSVLRLGLFHVQYRYAEVDG